MRITPLLLAFCLLAPLAAAQDDMDMAAMAAMAQPDENHEFLATFVGDWDYHSTMWMAPGAPPIEMDGTTSYTMGLGGRYLMGIHEGDMGGMPFEGRGLFGYDKAAGKYLASWIDNMGTGITLFEGHVEDGKLIMEAEYASPMTGTTDLHKMVQWIGTDGTGVMEYYVTVPGAEEMLSMRITYARTGE